MVVLDTNVLIEIIRGNREVIQVCDDLGTAHLAISSITRNEFVAGSRNKASFAQNLKFVNKFKLLRVTEPIDTIFTELCETYALSHRPDIPDMLIAATAIHHVCALYTLNTRDFHFIHGLLLVS